MLNMPTLKFDKSIKYLESQLDVQKNNKSLILDIISNIGLIINASSDKNTDELQSVLDTANSFLQSISNNITTLEQLKLEILNTTTELNEIITSQSKSTKSKEYYIATFSNIKNNIILYTHNLQDVENKLEQDNTAFNEFIKDNDFKYTFNTTNNEENTYELASFSINNDTTSISTGTETQDTSDDDIIDNGLEEAQAIKEENVQDETAVDEQTNTESDVAEEPSIEEVNELVEDVVEQDEQPSIEEEPAQEEAEITIDEQPDVEENVIEEPAIDEDDSVEDDTKEENIVEESVSEKSEIVEEEITEETSIASPEKIEEVTEESDEINETIEEEASELVEDVEETTNTNETESIEDVVEQDNQPSIEEEPAQEAAIAIDEQPDAEENVIEKTSIEEDASEEENTVEEPVTEEETTSPVDELADVFKEILVNLYDNKISEADFKAAITDLKSHLPNYKNKENEEPIQKVESIDEEIIIEDVVPDLGIEDIGEETAKINDEAEVTDVPENETILDEEAVVDENSLLETLLDDESIEINESEQEPQQKNENLSITSTENQKKQVETRHQSIEDMIKKIESAEEKNKVLLISEKTNKIYLPYRITELQNYIKYYPKAYKSLSDVVNQEFILDLSNFSKHPGKARFTETYNLVRNRSGKSFFKALSYALKVTNNRKLDPAVIAACKSEYELHCYLYCLEQNKFDSFKFFTTVYDVNLF